MRDRDLGGWAGAVIALILGIATFVAFGLATGTLSGAGGNAPEDVPTDLTT
jgi:hypothetical protein